MASESPCAVTLGELLATPNFHPLPFIMRRSPPVADTQTWGRLLNLVRTMWRCDDSLIHPDLRDSGDVSSLWGRSGTVGLLVTSDRRQDHILYGIKNFTQTTRSDYKSSPRKHSKLTRPSLKAPCFAQCTALVWVLSEWYFVTGRGGGGLCPRSTS